MANLDLEAIRRRVERATPGEWEWHELEDLPDEGETEGPKWLEVSSRDGHGVADLGLVHEADAEFIAHSRTDIPALIEEIERLRERVERLEEAAAPFAAWLPFVNAFEDEVISGITVATKDIRCIAALLSASASAEGGEGSK